MTDRQAVVDVLSSNILICCPITYKTRKKAGLAARWLIIIVV